MQTYVGCGSLAVITAPISDVRFTPRSGHAGRRVLAMRQAKMGCGTPMSNLPATVVEAEAVDMIAHWIDLVAEMLTTQASRLVLQAAKRCRHDCQGTNAGHRLSHPESHRMKTFAQSIGCKVPRNRVWIPDRRRAASAMTSRGYAVLRP